VIGREISKVVAHMWENIDPELKEVTSGIEMMNVIVIDRFSNTNIEQQRRRKNISNSWRPIVLCKCHIK
jgi:hypothetical protein